MKKSCLSTPTHNQKIIQHVNYVNFTPTNSHIYMNDGRANIPHTHIYNQNNPALHASNFYKQRLRKISTNSYEVDNNRNQSARLISLDALEDRFSINNSASNQTVVKQPTTPTPIILRSKVTNLSAQIPINYCSNLNFQTIKFSQSARVLPMSKLLIKTDDDQTKQQCQTPTLNQTPSLKKLLTFSNDQDFIIGSQQLISHNTISRQCEQKNMKKSKKLKRMQSNDQNLKNRDELLDTSPTYLPKKSKHLFKSPKSLKRYMKDGHLRVTKIYTQQLQRQEQSQNDCEVQQQQQQTQNNQQQRKGFGQQQQQNQDYEFIQPEQYEQYQKNQQITLQNLRLSNYFQSLYQQLQMAKTKLQHLQDLMKKNERLRKKQHLQRQLAKRNQRLKQLEQESEFYQNLPNNCKAQSEHLIIKEPQYQYEQHSNKNTKTIQIKLQKNVMILMSIILLLLFLLIRQ